MKTKEKHLYYLNELGDYKISSKDPDIRKWEVKDRDYMSIGKVDNLIVNKELDRVVYVDVEVNQLIIDKNHDPYSPDNNSGFREFINKEGENHIIIPIGLIDINVEEKFIHTDSLDHKIFAETKRYRTGDPISRDYEKNIISSYNRNYTPNEIQGKKAKLTDDEYVVDEYSARKSAHASNTTEERIAEEKANLHYKSETLHDRENAETKEERMERERAQLRANSTANDYRNSDSTIPAMPTSKEGIRPEKTYDDDTSWNREKHFLSEEEIESRERKRLRAEDDFYNRSEFKRRDH
ncbi:hypothetical protein [Zunongwangia endophytica]|uniref:PRC-barrel domain-containing protein n=1 Tax=Zunongwangia endophytica TaxID=1808945 RepID=A0ABV8H9V1_9FLAO|nr:hypothetical protein [Zunongwangia endophytica]MDN3593824.1 hypothetical protein [Zunongwangia endophytica]